MTRLSLFWVPVVAVVMMTIATALGPRGSISTLISRDPVEARILRDVRLPRVSLGFISGAALAAAGMAFQALFRNALATPYTLGVSAGASLGAAIAVHLGVTATIGGIAGSSFAAFAGALASIAIVYCVARTAPGFSTAGLLLAGVAVSFIFTSAILAIQYMGDVTTSFRTGRWLLGGLEVVGFDPVFQVVPFAAVGIGVLVVIARDLDLLTAGDESAATRGVNVATVKRVVFVSASLMVGGVVAICGPIGFVGLIVPHVGRMLVGPRHRALLPFSAVVGGTFLVACDALARIVVAPVEIPVGIITALIGGPCFLAMLVKGHTRQRVGGLA